MSYSTNDSASQKSSKVGPLISLLRAVLAIGLGLALLFYPDKSRSTLVTIFGIFWIIGGLISLRWDSNGDRPGRISLTASLILIGAGIVVLILIRMGSSLSDVILIWFIALVMILTGVIHMVFGFRTRSHPDGRWSASSFILGIFEIVLGAMLVFGPLSLIPLLYTVTGIWALVGALMLIGDAIAQRSLDKKDAEAPAP